MPTERAFRRLCRRRESADHDGMALWSFIQCRRCGFTGCSAPIGDACPACGHDLELDPPAKKKVETAEPASA
jgi:rubrerythrin